MMFAALLRAARWLPLTAALGGCANLPFFGAKEPAADCFEQPTGRPSPTRQRKLA